MVREICEAFEVMGAQNPLVLILEDLHWVDASTLDLISALARRRGPAKLVIVGTYRPADVIISQSPLKALKQDLLVHNLCHEIALERLEESDVGEYLTEVLAEKQQFIKAAGIHELANGEFSAHYEFRHSLYREVLYRQLSDVNRSKLHRLLGQRLKTLCTPSKPELAAELALHFEGGREYDQAISYLILAAENAARRFAYRDSIELLRHALELAQSLPARTRIELEIEVLQRMGDAHFALGAMSDSALAYEAAAARAAEAGLRKTQIEALARLAVPAWYLDPPRGNDICQQAAENSRAHGDPPP